VNTDRRDRSRAGQGVFGREHVPLVTPREAAALDLAARERHAIHERVLMESAGRAAACVLDRIFPRGSVTAIAGPGNNGGDALVLARVLRAWGRNVRVVLAANKPPDPALLHGFDLALESADTAQDAIAAADVIVDGVLGTGARGAPRAPASTAIEAMNACGRPILALDLPSGVDAETGDVEGEAVRAAATVSFGWPKLGLMLHPARARVGRLLVVEIGFPPLHTDGPDAAALITPDWAVARLPRRPPSAHKGTSGRLLVLAGQEGMAGAAAIACRAAQRAGAGLVRVASAASNRVVLQSVVPEATFADRDALAADDLATMNAVVAGPGLGTGDEARRALEAALSLTRGRPTVLDADALNLFARVPESLRRLSAERDVVLTPHPMELSRLTGTAVQEILEDPVRAARTTARQFGCAVLLKGQPSLLASHKQPLLVNTTGSSDLAAAGMGDQLSGVIGAMLAAGCSARDGAALALFFAGRAADLAARGRSLSPADVSDHLARAFARPGAAAAPLGLPFVTFDQPPRW
jgi:NAD(P)H-hydrate epimerase